MKTTNRPVIHLDLNQPVELVLVWAGVHAKHEQQPADFGNATGWCWNDGVRRRGRRAQAMGRHRNRLPGNPLAWRGGKIQHRKTGAAFAVRRVFQNGRVELQKRFACYLSDVKATRKDAKSIVGLPVRITC